MLTFVIQKIANLLREALIYCLDVSTAITVLNCTTPEPALLLYARYERSKQVVVIVVVVFMRTLFKASDTIFKPWFLKGIKQFAIIKVGTSIYIL